MDAYERRVRGTNDTDDLQPFFHNTGEQIFKCALTVYKDVIVASSWEDE